MWDWNGTLLDDVEVCISAMNELTARRGLPSLTVGCYREMFTFPVQDYYQRLGFDFAEERFDDVAVEYHVAYESRVGGAPLRPDAIRALETVEKGGVPQTVLSALEEGRLLGELRKREIRHYFAHIYGLNDLHARSKIERGQELLAVLDCDQKNVWMIGDTVHDAEVADALGIRCVLVTFGHHGPSRVAATGRPTADSLTEAVHRVLAEEG